MSTPRHPLEALMTELAKYVALELKQMQAAENVQPAGLISVPEIARRVGRTPRTVKNWDRAGLLKLRSIRGHLYASTKEFNEFISKTDGRRRRSTLKVA